MKLKKDNFVVIKGDRDFARMGYTEVRGIVITSKDFSKGFVFNCTETGENETCWYFNEGRIQIYQDWREYLGKEF